MKKRDCSTCDHYGKCSVESESCADWAPFMGKTASLDVVGFDKRWREAHVRTAWEALMSVVPNGRENKTLARLHAKAILPDPEEEALMDARIEANARFLCGKKEEELLAQMEGDAYQGALEEARK